MKIPEVLRFFKKQLLYVFAGCLMLLILGAYIYLKNLQKNTTADAYTELYFVSAQQLPQNINEQPETVQFAIHNVEKKTVTYTYLVLVRTNGLDRLIDQRKTVIANNGIDIISETIPPSKSQQYKDLIIYLLNSNQEIHLNLAQST